MTNELFEKGDFLKKDSKKGSFMIYEGNDLSEGYSKKYTLVCYYDPEKYKMTSLGYNQVPHLEVASNTKRCSETVDTIREDFWIKKCTEKEKAEALKVLENYGYHWDEENMCLIDTTTGEVVKKITLPDNTYYGQIIRPITEAFKAMLKRFCIQANKPSYSTRYSEYDDYYD